MSRNSIAKILSTIGWFIYIGGAIAGIVIGNVEVPYTFTSGSYTEFSFALAFTYWAISFVSGTVFIGFSEIIHLLQKLVDKGESIGVINNSGEIENNSEQFNDLPKLE